MTAPARVRSHAEQPFPYGALLQLLRQGDTKARCKRERIPFAPGFCLLQHRILQVLHGIIPKWMLIGYPNLPYTDANSIRSFLPIPAANRCSVRKDGLAFPCSSLLISD